MKIKLLAVGLCAVMCGAQTPVMTMSVPAGAIYQAAVMNGIDYINPTTGQDILNKKASLNWKTIAGQVLAEGSIGVVTGGLSGVLHIPTGALIGLTVGHSYYDRSIAPIIAGAAPSPANIAPVLQMTGAMAPSVNACVENSMYASSVNNIPAKLAISKKKKLTAPTVVANPVFAMVSGLNVSFSPQGLAVLKDLSGAAIDQFMVIDVLACVPQVTLNPAMLHSESIHINPDAISNVSLTSMETHAIDNRLITITAADKIYPVVTSEDFKSITQPVTQSFNNGIDKQIHETLERATHLPVVEQVASPVYQPVTVSFSQPVSDPKTAELLNQKGRLLIASGNYSEAVTQLKKAVSLDPNSKTALNALGFSLHLSHNDKDAVMAYDRAIALDASYANAKLNRSISIKVLYNKKEII